jgi:hypothetical protein
VGRAIHTLSESAHDDGAGPSQQASQPTSPQETFGARRARADHGHTKRVLEQGDVPGEEELRWSLELDLDGELLEERLRRDHRGLRWRRVTFAVHATSRGSILLNT